MRCVNWVVAPGAASACEREAAPEASRDVAPPETSEDTEAEAVVCGSVAPLVCDEAKEAKEAAVWETLVAAWPRRPARLAAKDTALCSSNSSRRPRETSAVSRSSTCLGVS